MQSIGERFEEARKKKGVSIREAAEATKIRGDYLQRFEGNQFDLDLAPIYVKGFLRSYASFLKISADRILDDYAARGHDSAPRQPSREVYGRMDLSIATADDRTEPASGAPAATAAEPTRVPRGRSNLPAAPLIEPALIFKGGIAIGILLVAILAFWALKSIFSESSSAAVTPAAVAAVLPDSVVTISALDAAKIKVVRRSDGVELYQGSLERGEHRDFPNIPLYLTSNALEALEIVYKGRHYPTGQTGYLRVSLDFSTVK
jgi:transcriptional regulator with XRE-family HTH domain